MTPLRRQAGGEVGVGVRAGVDLNRVAKVKRAGLGVAHQRPDVGAAREGGLGSIVPSCRS